MALRQRPVPVAFRKMRRSFSSSKGRMCPSPTAASRTTSEETQGVQQAVVVGAGFIGLELVENLVRLGVSTTVVFDPDSGKVLGAQGVGGSGVNKRIDVLAVAIQAGMTVFDLEEMELAYAPQFGSAKDPINMVGFVAAGLIRDDHPQTSGMSFADAIDEDKSR